MDTEGPSLFDALTWREQSKIQEAVPTALLFGKTSGKNSSVWIFLLENTPALIWRFCIDDELDEVLDIEEVLGKVAPCLSFQLATTPVKLDALATYYFKRKKPATKYDLSLTGEQKRVLWAMLGVEAPSKVVKPRTRTPDNFPVQHQIDTNVSYDRFFWD